MSTLVLVEHNNSHINPSIYSTLSAALQLDKEPTLLIIGHNCEQVAHEASVIEGVKTVLMVDNPRLEHSISENVCDIIISIANSYSAILAPASTFGKNILPCVAAKLDVTQISDVTKIISNDTYEHPIYAGNAIETVKNLDAMKVLTIRTTAFNHSFNKQAPCCIERLPYSLPEEQQVTFLKQELTASKRPNLGNAKIIISGGRGLQNAEKFKLVEELADTLGAAVGASRAAVDAGYVSNDYQVGQTGKIVAPTLYFAIGISGAIQHLAGMKDSKVIVAINKDADAPIFQIADYGLVGDLFELIPQLIEQLKNN